MRAASRNVLSAIAQMRLSEVRPDVRFGRGMGPFPGFDPDADRGGAPGRRSGPRRAFGRGPRRELGRLEVGEKLLRAAPQELEIIG